MLLLEGLWEDHREKEIVQQLIGLYQSEGLLCSPMKLNEEGTRRWQCMYNCDTNVRMQSCTRFPLKGLYTVGKTLGG